MEMVETERLMLRRPNAADVPAIFARYASDPQWRDLALFHEYFDGDTGRGLGASHQTGWTALVVRCLEAVARSRQPLGAHYAYTRDSWPVVSVAQ